MLPEGYFAEEHAHTGARVESDVATFRDDASPDASPTTGTVTRPARTYTPPAPALVVPAAFPDAFEVLVYQSEGGARLVAAVELVGPAHFAATPTARRSRRSARATSRKASARSWWTW